MQKKRIKLGLAPTRRFVVSVEDAHRYKKLVEDKLRHWDIDFINIDSINKEGLLINMADCRKAAELFKRENVDAVFSPHVNFGTEEAVCICAKMVGKPFLLWGPRDEMPPASLSDCGKNMLSRAVSLMRTRCRWAISAATA